MHQKLNSDGFYRYISIYQYIAQVKTNRKIDVHRYTAVDETKLCDMFKALSDSNRMTIFVMLSKGETCACKLLEALDVSQPTLSHHMSILQKSGLVTGRKEGQWIHYTLNHKAISEIQDFLGGL